MINLKAIYSNLICEGGASGHMTHLFEDPDLTFAELRDIFTQLFTGKISVSEKCLAPDTKVILEKNGEKTIKEVVDNKITDNILTYDYTNNISCYEPIIGWTKNSNSTDWLKITLDNGLTIICTPNHRIYSETAKHDVKAEDLNISDELVIL